MIQAHHKEPDLTASIPEAHESWTLPNTYLKWESTTTIVSLALQSTGSNVQYTQVQ